MPLALGQVGMKALAAGIAAAAPVYWVLSRVLPHAVAAESFVPHGMALMAAVTIALHVQVRDDPTLRTAARSTAIACGLAALVVALGLAFGGAEVISGSARNGGRTTCVGLALAAWLFGAWRERRGGRRIPEVTAVIVGFAIAGFGFENAGSLHETVTGRGEQGWNVYHYYMGSKYFPELGYGELYTAHLAADVENGGRDYAFVEKARSMATYRETPRAKLLAGFHPRKLFSETRWRDFRHDVHAFRPLLDPDKWKGVLIDLGYHPSPAWTIVGTPFANAVSVRGRGWWLLACSDLPLHLLSLVAMLWAFGLRPTALAVLWVAAMPINSANFAGAFLRHDWLHSALLAVALWHRGHPASAGVALSWGAMTRIFPGMLAVPIVLRLVGALARGGPRAIAPAHLRFVVALSVACALLFGASHFTGRGARVWPEWLGIITKHGHLHPATSNRRVGLGRLVLQAPRAGAFFDTVKGSYEQKVQARTWPLRIGQVMGLALLVAAAWRRRDMDAMILMTFAIFLLTTLSRYHGSIWMLLFFLGAERARAPDAPTPGPAFAAGAVLLGIVTVFFAAPGMTAQYYVLNDEMLALFSGLCVAYVIADRRVRTAPSVA